MEDPKSPCDKLIQGMNKMKPYLAMVSLQFGYAGMYVISLVSLNHGMNHYVLSVYRHIIAENKAKDDSTNLPENNAAWPVFAQNLYNVGMKYTSATFASATVNILPAITFILALIFSVAKVIGTTVTVAGAVVTTMYKGPCLDIFQFHGQGRQLHHTTTTTSSDEHWVTGTLMLLARCGGWSSFFVLQSFTLKKYPAELSLTAWICFMGALEGAVVTLVMERDTGVWAIGLDSRLLAAAYSGVVCSGIAYYMQGKVMKERGPVFVTAFSPLCMIITAALGAIVLAEQVHLGSLIGAIIIVFGLYSLVWGKSKDPKGLAASEDPLDETTSSVSLELPVTITSSTKSSTKITEC
ncbi:hypothetical protein FEM48_Zijuj06G0126800 [Ziziphus jujuba var. spinosa]|uniref:WAT1-related protein n=1 Tax=Ziziphus jujuba var. spinosa TaxID=714518 RepID=A0A978V9C3_ZIZJJ|nr:hypothetical protein FEM48_Zijuj06G0126800 [Ziziphus jujuba var. spinosa]